MLLIGHIWQWTHSLLMSTSTDYSWLYVLLQSIWRHLTLGMKHRFLSPNIYIQTSGIVDTIKQFYKVMDNRIFLLIPQSERTISFPGTHLLNVGPISLANEEQSPLEESTVLRFLCRIVKSWPCSRLATILFWGILLLWFMYTKQEHRRTSLNLYYSI